jgi:hypothetical protein
MVQILTDGTYSCGGKFRLCIGRRCICSRGDRLPYANHSPQPSGQHLPHIVRTKNFSPLQ